MSRAFTKEGDDEFSLADIGEKPVSQERNLVTEEGLSQIDKQLSSLRDELGLAEKAGNREKMATISRDLRYWSARRENAELSVPEPDEKVVRFGMTVTIVNEEGREAVWKIVGEDEADAANGKISHVSPMAKALFGKAVGEVATVNGADWEIIGLKAQ
ncbi:MAG: GreA/GreB family elongation factor [Rhizobiaceae bacterium]|nr:GreA/GreB family elongation factor [Rhizobiaceae bacterium]